MMRRNAFAVLFSSVMMVGVGHFAYGQDGLPELPSLPGEAAPAPADAPAPGVVPAPTPAAGDPAVGTMPGQAPAPVAGMAVDPAAGATLPGALPALPTLPGAQPDGAGQAGELPGALPALPGLPVGAIPGAPVAAAPTPPAVEDIGVQSSDATGASAVPQIASESTLYSFLFVEIPEYGIVRHRFEEDVAEQLKQAEITRLREQRRTAGQPAAILGVTPMLDGMGGMPGGMMDPAMGGMMPGGMDNAGATEAAAEWDFYYQQLEMYDRFVRERLIPGADDLPELQYDASNALQERQDLFESFQEAAIVQASDDANANADFYERLARREDRRSTYLEWLRLRQQAVQDWSEVWAREVYGTRWADGEVVRLDDWYYGVDFNSANPVTIEIDDREYVISRGPVDRLKHKQLNVISTNLTPYDIIDANGELKNPVMETLRGTMVMPPAPPVYTTGPGIGGAGTAGQATGMIEIVGGVGSE